MEIKILQLIEGARKAEGLTVIIDVFRAFSVACYLIDNGVEKIYPVGSIEEAFQLKEENPGYILIGERGGKKVPGFDYGNSPSVIENLEMDGKTVVHATSAGTRGIVNATGAEEIITGSFVNAGAIIEYIKSRNPGQLSLVCMGEAGVEPAEEDIYCAEYIKNALLGKENNFVEITKELREGAGERFFDPARDWSPESDFYLCLDKDRFDFVPGVDRDSEGLPVIKEIKDYY